MFAPQDFYENLFMSEKIVDGHVKLALVRSPLARDIAPPPQPGPARQFNRAKSNNADHTPAPSQQPTVESSEDEEEAWSKWETANHERYEREKELARRTGRSPSGSSSKQPPSKSGILRQKRPESPVGRRGPRARNDPSYAALLDRRDQNTRKVWQAKMKTGDDDDAGFLRAALGTLGGRPGGGSGGSAAASSGLLLQRERDRLPPPPPP